MTHRFHKLPRRFAYWLALLPISLGICIPAQAVEFGVGDRIQSHAISHNGTTDDLGTGAGLCVDEEATSPSAVTTISEKHRAKKKILPRRSRTAGKRGLSLLIARDSDTSLSQPFLPSFKSRAKGPDLIRTRISRTRHNGYGGHLIS